MAVKILPKPSNFLHSRPIVMFPSLELPEYLRGDWVTILTSRCGVLQKRKGKEKTTNLSYPEIHSIFGASNAKRKPLIHLFNDLTGIGMVTMHLETLSIAFAQCVCCRIVGFLPGFVM